MTTSTCATSKTGNLQMVRAQIESRDFRRWMGERRLRDPDHAMHCLLTECFGELAPRPFRTILPRDGSNGTLYGYGRSDASVLRESVAMCADPLQSRVLPVDGLDSKPMPESWEAGKRLGFEVRLRPVVRLHKDLWRVPTDRLRLFRVDRPGKDEPEERPRPGKECDVFLWEAILHPEGEMKRSREQVYTEWLSEQLDRRGGARLEPERTRLVSFQRIRAFRKAQPAFRHSEGPDAVIRGILTITNPESFADLLAKGIGRHKAYGYGMLLLRPTGRSG